MLKNIISVFLGVVLAAVFLVVAYDFYVGFKINKAQEIAHQIALDNEIKKRDDAEYLKQGDQDDSVKFCVKAATEHHNNGVELLNVVKKTITFAAIDYVVGGQNYHARCTFQYNSHVIDTFSTAVN
jgi:hypothetical protein